MEIIVLKKEVGPKVIDAMNRIIERGGGSLFKLK